MAVVETGASKEAAGQFNGNFQADFLSVEQLSANDLDELHKEADAARWLSRELGEYPVLQGHIYDLVFWLYQNKRIFQTRYHSAGCEIR